MESESGLSLLARPEVISVTSSPSGDRQNIQIYINGVSDSIHPNSVMISSPTGGFYIGSKDSSGSLDNWKGFISEVIVFDKKLSDEDRKAIEKYLGTKYNIGVTV